MEALEQITLKLWCYSMRKPIERKVKRGWWMKTMKYKPIENFIVLSRSERYDVKQICLEDEIKKGINDLNVILK